MDYEINTYIGCESEMPPEEFNEELGVYDSDMVKVLIKNVGGGIVTYEEGYDWTCGGEWIDGDGMFGRTTIAWMPPDGEV